MQRHILDSKTFLGGYLYLLLLADLPIFSNILSLY